MLLNIPSAFVFCLQLPRAGSSAFLSASPKPSAELSYLIALPMGFPSLWFSHYEIVHGQPVSFLPLSSVLDCLLRYFIMLE